jgi:hypothetical protein
MTTPTITDPPTTPVRGSANFSNQVAAFLSWLSTFADDELTAFITWAEALTASLDNAANAAEWVSGTDYEIGDRVWSPTDLQLYQSTAAFNSTTDPVNDSDNWDLTEGFPVSHISDTDNPHAVTAEQVKLGTAMATVTVDDTDPDALTFTTGRNLTALTAGMWFAAMINTTNTGAMTVAIDGLTAVDVKTVIGVDTPADYIRTDVPTEFYYDGTNLIAKREPEYGSNANGEYAPYANGAQTCMDGILSDNAAAVSWTYPKAFAAAPIITVAARGSSGRSASYDNPGATACEFYAWLSDGTQTTTACHVTAHGQWYL